MKRVFKYVFILIFILGCGAYGFYYYTKPLGVEVLELQKKNVFDYIENTGNIVSQTETDISSKAFGQVLTVYHKDGDTVKKGELLIKLDGTDIGFQENILRNQMNATAEQKKAGVDELKGSISLQTAVIKQLDQEILNKKKDLEYNTWLFNQGDLSQNELDVFQQAYDRLLSQKNQAELTLKTYKVSYQDASSANGSQGAIRAQLSQLENQRKQTKIYANASGVLIDFNVKKGGIVTNQGTIGKIVNPESYKIEAFVLTEDAYNLKVGDPLKIILKINGKDKESSGEIIKIAQIAQDWISPLGLSEKRVKVTITPDKAMEVLRIGSEVKVKFISEYKMGTLAVPKTSIFYREDKKLVLVDRQGIAKEVVITTGMDTDTEFAVESGLNPGDKLIKNFKVEGLKDGKKVTYTNK